VRVHASLQRRDMGQSATEFKVKTPTSGNTGQKWGTHRFTTLIDG